jgi:hypothetical protein
MRSTRSFAPPRLLPYRSPEVWAIRSEFFVFQLLFGFLPLIACIVGFQQYGKSAVPDLLDPKAPMVRLAKPLNEEEEARGVLRAGGKLTGGEEVCVLVHEYKSGKNWREDFRATIGDSLKIDIEYENGVEPQVQEEPIDVDWPSVRWEPEMIRKETDREAAWRQRVKIPPGGRLYEACVRRGEGVFIDACETRRKDNHRIAGPCGARRAVATAGNGTPQPRIDQLAASTAGQVSLLGGAALLVLLYLWRVAGARPFVAGLFARLGSQPSPLVAKAALWMIGLAPLGLLLGLFLFRGVPDGAAAAKVERYGYAVTYAVFGGALILGVLMRDRRRALRAVITGVRGEAVSSLKHPTEGQRVTLEAEVDPQAPLSTGQLTGATRAYWAVSATRVYRSGRNYSSSVQPSVSGAQLVPIRGPFGAALLDLTYGWVDLRSKRLIARKRAIKRGDFRHIVGEQAPFDGAFVLEERFLDPGEALYIAGEVQRLAAPSLEGGYRETGALPVIGGSSMVVHAGSRRSLLRGILVEKGFLDAALAGAGVILAFTAGLVAYLISL